jgi:hypothetical protein
VPDQRQGFEDPEIGVDLSPFEFLDRLADLVPPPQKLTCPHEWNQCLSPG